LLYYGKQQFHQKKRIDGKITAINKSMNDNNQSIVLQEAIRSVPVSSNFEIVGLYGDSNGRCCAEHSECGRHLRVGDICRLVKTQVRINSEEEDAIALVKIKDATETCTVGFIPRSMLKNKIVLNQVEKEVQVLEIYEQSENTTKQRMAKRNHGMASVCPLSMVPRNR
jgi:hypothetical protein